MYKIVLNCKLETFGNTFYCNSYEVSRQNGYVNYKFQDCLYTETYKNLPFIDYEEEVVYKQGDDIWIPIIPVKYLLTYVECFHFAGKNIFKMYRHSNYFQFCGFNYKPYPATVEKLTRVETIDYNYLDDRDSDFKSVEICNDYKLEDFKFKSEYEQEFKINLQVLQTEVDVKNNEIEAQRLKTLWSDPFKTEQTIKDLNDGLQSLETKIQNIKTESVKKSWVYKIFKMVYKLLKWWKND